MSCTICNEKVENIIYTRIGTYICICKYVLVRYNCVHA